MEFAFYYKDVRVHLHEACYKRAIAAWHHTTVSPLEVMCPKCREEIRRADIVATVQAVPWIPGEGEEP